MSLKQLQAKSFTFYYFDEPGETWWALSPIFKFCEISGYPKKVFQTLSFAPGPTKTFQEFATSYKIFPPQTLFLSEKKTMEFLSFFGGQKKARAKDIQQLISFLKRKNGEIVTSSNFVKSRQKKVFTALEKKILQLPLEGKSSEQTVVLTTYVQELLEMATLAQSYVQSQEVLTGSDVMRIHSYAGMHLDTARHLSNLTNHPLYIVDMDLVQKLQSVDA